MIRRKHTFFVLVITLILLVTTIGPTHAWSSALSADPLSHNDAAASNSGGVIGKPFIIDDEIAGVQTWGPAVAFNSQRQEYLVVWWNDRTGCDDIAGQRVSWNGAPIGAKIWIANGCPADRRYPAVAYNSQDDEYLVAWNEDYVDIRGQLLSGTGGITGGAFDIALSVSEASSSYQSNPVVAYAATENKYLVVFDSHLTTGHGIYARALNRNGSAWGTSFEVESLSTSSILQPDLAYNHMTNEFLVVWTQSNPSYWDIRGRRVKMSGGAGTLGSAFWFSCDPSKEDLAPAVAAVPRSPSGQYLVVWRYDASLNDTDIWAQRVDGGGTLEGSAFMVSNNTGYDSAPAVAGSNSNQQYLVTWRSELALPPPNPTLELIVGRSIATNGSFLSDVTWIAGLKPYSSAVVSGSAGDMLIAYEEYASGETDIFGVLWGNRVYLPLLVR
jgi:hypothetical protein